MIQQTSVEPTTLHSDQSHQAAARDITSLEAISSTSQDLMTTTHMIGITKQLKKTPSVLCLVFLYLPTAN